MKTLYLMLSALMCVGLTLRFLLCRVQPEVSISLPFLSLLSCCRYSLGKQEQITFYTPQWLIKINLQELHLGLQRFKPTNVSDTETYNNILHASSLFPPIESKYRIAFLRKSTTWEEELQN